MTRVHWNCVEAGDWKEPVKRKEIDICCGMRRKEKVRGLWSASGPPPTHRPSVRWFVRSSTWRSGVSICKSIFDWIIDIRKCKQNNSKTFSVFIFSNFIHLPFFQRKTRLSKRYIFTESALSFGENKTHKFNREDLLLSLFTTLVINRQPLPCCN